MKSVFAWIVYFLVCGTVITAAIVAGSKHARCYQCEIAFDGKSPEKDKFAGKWLFND